MPIDSKLRKEYFKEYMRSRRAKLKGVNELDLNVNTVNTSSELTPKKHVNTQEKVLTPEFVKPVNTSSTPNPIVNTSKTVNTSADVKPCPLNHYSLTELFRQAAEQVKSAWIKIRSQGGAEQCYNCHNSQRNHQLAINLLEKYWVKSKRLERGREPM